jgi:2,5-diketo-D-gluconate reductase A
MPIPAVTLNNGVRMPILGFGVYQVPEDQTERAVTDALEVGYRAIDTAASYGNEAAVGRAIARSGIAREDLFITTKMWIQRTGVEMARREFDGSLGRLGLDYLDLYLIHQPFGDYYSSWHAMEQIYADGLVRAIGVSNFHADRLFDLNLHNGVTTAVNQVETNPFHQRGEDHRLMSGLGVQIESWAPFAGRRRLQVRSAGSDGGEPACSRLRAHRRRHGADRRARHRQERVLRPPRPRDGRVARAAPSRLGVRGADRPVALSDDS